MKECCTNEYYNSWKPVIKREILEETREKKILRNKEWQFTSYQKYWKSEDNGIVPFKYLVGGGNYQPKIIYPVKNTNKNGTS